MLYYFCSFVINNGPAAPSPGRFNRRQPKWGQAIYLLYTHTRKDFVTFFFKWRCVFEKKKKEKRKMNLGAFVLRGTDGGAQLTKHSKRYINQSSYFFSAPTLPNNVLFFPSAWLLQKQYTYTNREIKQTHLRYIQYNRLFSMFSVVSVYIYIHAQQLSLETD